MIDSGVYQLLIGLDHELTLTIGSLGKISLKAGEYIYIGSAKGNLRKRLARHFRKDKKLFWHIDYLLTHGEIVAFSFLPYETGLECRLHRETLAKIPQTQIIEGFGCSDCKCNSHLIYIVSK